MCVLYKEYLKEISVWFYINKQTAVKGYDRMGSMKRLVKMAFDLFTIIPIKTTDQVAFSPLQSNHSNLESDRPKAIGISVLTATALFCGILEPLDRTKPIQYKRKISIETRRVGYGDGSGTYDFVQAQVHY